MICFVCHRPIRSGDMSQRYEWRKAGTITLIHGKGLFPLKDAGGRLVQACHNKCYHQHLKQLQLAEAKAADPSAQPRPDQDWRHQDVMEVGELTGEGNRGDRGTGAAGR